MMLTLKKGPETGFGPPRERRRVVSKRLGERGKGVLEGERAEARGEVEEGRKGRRGRRAGARLPVRMERGLMRPVRLSAKQPRH